MNRQSTIRSQLTWLVLACVIPISIVVAGLVVLDYYENRALLVRDSQAVTRAMMSAVDRELAAQQAALSVLATSPHLRASDMAAFYRQAKETLVHHRATTVVLVDRSYQQRINTLLPFGAPLPIQRDHEGVQRIFATGRPVVSDVFIGPVAKKPLVSILVPVYERNTLVYALGTGVLPEKWAEVLTEQKLPPDWIAAIFDSKGTIVARTHESDRFVGQKGAPALIHRMTQVSDGSIETTTVEGIRVVSVFTRSSISNWGVAIGIPVASLTAELWQSVRWVIGGIVVLLVSSLSIASLIAYRLARSVGELKKPAIALGRGETISVPDLRLKEVNDVGQALVRASELLAASRHRATHDPLTGLANRALLGDILDQQLTACRRTGGTLSVLYIDLDGFKQINDMFGHVAGDDLLRAFASKLKDIVRGSDVAARLGGDEFAVMLVDTDGEGAAIVAEKLISGASIIHPASAHELSVSVSIGIATYPECEGTADAMLHCADEAMYRAKAGGKGRYVAAAQYAEA